MQDAIVIDDHQPIPEFDSAFRESSPYFYFHHIIDPVAATLRIEVIGPNLTYTFHHERAKELLSASEIANRLERKTVGFLALVVEGGKRRISLSWAESGHGAGRDGDLLDADPSVLPNDVWTKRVIAVGKISGLNMRRPFDGSVSIAMGRDLSGVFLGGHVEVKLAVHAIFVLLNIFNVTQDLDNLSRRHLRMLRSVRWQDGTRPTFEIYFSRKNCAFCGSLVKKLEALTGVPLRLVWKERLVKVVYAKKTLDKTRGATRPRPQQRQRQQEEDEDNIEDDETVIADDVQLVDYIDLTGDSSHPLRNPRDNAPPLADIINLIDDEEEVNDDDNNAVNSPSRSPTPPSSPRQQQQRIAADAYIDGLAYCVGQIDQCPQGAQTAIIELAKTVSRQRNSSTRRAPAPRNHHAWSCISKPLPATPETQPPGWMAAQPAAAPAGAPQMRGQAAVEAPVREDQLPTPPASQSKQESKQQQQRPGPSQRDRSKSPSELHQRRRQANVQIRQRSPRRQYSMRGGKKKDVLDEDDDDVNTGRFRRVSICVETPTRRYSSSSPDPF